MFEQSILPRGRTRSRWAVPLVMLGELAIVGVLILIPLIYVQALPMAQLTSMLTLPPPPPPPPTPPAPAVARPKIIPRQFKLNAFTAPATIPKTVVINAVPDAPTPSAVTAGVPGGVPGGVAGGSLGGILGSIKAAAPPPPPPPPPAPAATPTPSRIQVGGQVQAAKIVKQIMPTYPKLAHDAHIGGTVRLKAIIAADGTVKDLSVISGHPLLIPSALNAVKQWVYKPTILNGTPIEVDTEIDVNFQLSAT